MILSSIPYVPRARKGTTLGDYDELGVSSFYNKKEYIQHPERG
jgi:hypothetical protein